MKFFADPVAWVWFGLVIGGIICMAKDRKRLLLVLYSLALAGSLVEMFQIPARLLASLERPYLSDTLAHVEAVEAVLVLGGYGAAFPQDPVGLELNDSGDRLLKGIALMREQKAKVLILSGGANRNTPRIEAEAARAWMKSWQLVSQPIEVLPPALNTKDEALKLSELAARNGWKRIILVTSAWHLRRAAATFRKAGVKVIPVGADFQGTSALQSERRWTFIPRTGTLNLLRIWLEEQFGYASYWVKGWV